MGPLGDRAVSNSLLREAFENTEPLDLDQWARESAVTRTLGRVPCQRRCFEDR